MDDFKEFQGKSLDEAIHNACTYFDAKREKLEIDIVQDAKSGLFGIVGVRKAVIRAKRAASVRGSVGAMLNRQGAARSAETGEETPVSATPPARSGEKTRSAAKTRVSNREKPETQEREGALNAERPGRNRRPAAKVSPIEPEKAPYPAGAPVQTCEEAPSRQERAVSAPLPPAENRASACEDVREAGGDTGMDDDEGHEVSFDQLDQAKLAALAEETARRLVTPILGEAPLTVEISNGHVDVHVDCGEHSGLLIGREGQTLSALQYLASRIVSTGMQASVRVQFNAGDYRERQDERLRELAFVLADRVRATGRSCSTRPMSSYHRRIVHLALQDSPDVQTRSSGEGPLKRVIVQKRKSA